MQKILVLRGGALGDFIVTLPALGLLRHRWPQARIEFAGNATAAAIGQTERVIDVVHSQHEARWAALYGGEKLPAEFARWLTDFDLVLSYWPDPEGELARRFPLRNQQTFLSAAAVPTEAPAAAHYCAPLRALGCATADYFFPLKNVDAPIRDRIAIHPGSGSPRKNWPRERWTALCEWLHEKFSAELRIVVGEAEADAASVFAKHGRVLVNLPLPKLASELAGCSLFLGHDSGVSHLAAACGLSCVLLFGPTDPAMWAPPSSRVSVLRRGPEMNSISLADVQHAVTTQLAIRA